MASSTLCKIDKSPHGTLSLIDTRSGAKVLGKQHLNTGGIKKPCL